MQVFQLSDREAVKWTAFAELAVKRGITLPTTAFTTARQAAAQRTVRELSPEAVSAMRDEGRRELERELAWFEMLHSAWAEGTSEGSNGGCMLHLDL